MLVLAQKVADCQACILHTSKLQNGLYSCMEQSKWGTQVFEGSCKWCQLTYYSKQNHQDSEHYDSSHWMGYCHL